MDPLVSILIPAYRAQEVLPRCLASLARGENAGVAAEILVESDDGTDYASADPRVRAVNGGHVRSGVGAARGRALARARAPFVTYIDADDEVAPDYLPRLLAARGPALAVTEVVEDGQPIARFGAGRLDFAELARHGASFRGIFPRATCPGFDNDLSQDILHLVEVMLRHGPLPVVNTAYRLHLAASTVTAASDFSARVDAAYLRHIDRLAARYPDHPDLAQAQGVFHAKRNLNRAYAETRDYGESYYAFIARQSEKDVPQPQEDLALGFSTTNRAPINSSVKSITAFSRNGSDT